MFWYRYCLGQPYSPPPPPPLSFSSFFYIGTRSSQCRFLYRYCLRHPQLTSLAALGEIKGAKLYRGIELRSCVSGEVGLGSHSQSCSSPIPNEPYGFCGRKARQKKNGNAVQGSWLGLVIRHQAGKQKDLSSILLRLSSFFKGCSIGTVL